MKYSNHRRRKQLSRAYTGDPEKTTSRIPTPETRLAKKSHIIITYGAMEATMATIATTTTSANCCLTREEQSMLKTALAFVVLRNNRKRQLQNTRRIDDVDSILPFCRNLLPIQSTISTAPIKSAIGPTPQLPPGTAAVSCDKDHVQRMLAIALSAANSLHIHHETTGKRRPPTGKTNTHAAEHDPSPRLVPLQVPAAVVHHEVVYVTAQATERDNARLTSIALHLARHLEESDELWLLDWITTTTLQHETKSICSVWHYLAQQSAPGGKSSPRATNNLILILIKAIGQLINKIYHDQVLVTIGDADTLVVNLLLLLEALLSMRLEGIATNPIIDSMDTTYNTDNSSTICIMMQEQVLQVLLDALDPKLTLFIPIQEMPAYLQANNTIASSPPRNQSNLSAPSKVLLHLALYDMILKLY
jgi:hypothetical protein